MSITPKGMSIQELYRLFREGKLIVNRKYQRKLIWDKAQKEGLIDSIIHKYPIPLILLAETPKIYGPGIYEILDGVQRLTAIFDFIENRITWDNKVFDIEQFTTANNFCKNGDFIPQYKTNEKINSEVCANYLDYHLAVTIYTAMEEQEMIDIFGRINSQGRLLSPQEQRQAGVINKFSELVRDISCQIRGDVSKKVLTLFEMPEISIDDYRSNMDYGIKADDIFWCKQGILLRNELKNSEDEEMIADILVSILLDKPFAKSKEKLDELYNDNTSLFSNVQIALTKLNEELLTTNIIDIISIIKEIIESCDNSINAFRKIVSENERNTNAAKYPFYAFFMAFYNLMVEEELSPSDYKGIITSINKLQSRLTKSSHYASPEERTKNIDITKGLIRKYFTKKEPSALKHGPGLAIDFENSLRRSKSESSRYEFKQGLYDITEQSQLNKDLLNRLIETIAGIANSGTEEDGYLYIGVADKKSDAERIKIIYKTQYIELSDKYIVGIDREIKKNNIKFDDYMRKILSTIKESKLSDPLKTQLLSQIDNVEYKGFSIIRIRIPKQKTITYVDGDVFTRHGSNTIKLESAKEIVALSKLLEQV